MDEYKRCGTLIKQINDDLEKKLHVAHPAADLISTAMVAILYLRVIRRKGISTGMSAG